MPDRLPSLLAPLAERVVSPEAANDPLPALVTGELATLLRWWRDRSTTPTVAPVAVELNAASAASPDALARGLAAVDAAVDAGATVVVLRLGTPDDLAARAVIATLCHKDAPVVVDQPAGMTDRTWMERCVGVRNRIAQVSELRGTPLTVVDELDAPDIAFGVAVLIGAAARRTPCLLEGVDALAAAVVADRVCFRATGWWRPGATSLDPAACVAVERIGVEAGLPFGLSDDGGLGARATIALLELLLAADDDS